MGLITRPPNQGVTHLKYIPIFSLTTLLAFMASPVTAETTPVDLAPTADMIAQKYMLVDTHIDVPERLNENWEDVSRATAKGEFDYPRARKGGLNVPFMSIYTPAESEAKGTSYQLANRLIDSVEALVGRAPGKFMIVTTPAEAEIAMKKGLIGLAMGMENGSPLDGKLENVAFFRNRGISYITLTHALSNQISDSSYDEHHQWEGLSPFGKEVVREMNRQGVMVDISHVTDQAFWQVLEISEVPVIASHSSPRYFTPGFERNMSDEMIKALADKGGVIQVNFGSSFLTAEANAWYEQMDKARDAFAEAGGFDGESPEVTQFVKSYREAHLLPYATMDDVVAAFQHVIELVGVEHVGIGSDFDGVGDSLPVGMKDVSSYPNLIEALLKLEYSVEDIAKIMGGNLMRVWQAVDTHALEAAAGSDPVAH
jgi:membrane dipeptidase